MNSEQKKWLKSLEKSKFYSKTYKMHEYGIFYSNITAGNFDKIQEALNRVSRYRGGFSVNQRYDTLFFGFENEDALDDFIMFCAANYLPPSA